MIIVNRTRLSDAALRKLLEFAAGPIDHAGIWVEVHDTHYDAEGAMMRPPPSFRRAAKAGAEALIEIKYTVVPSQFPHHSLPERNGGGPLIVTRTPDELLLTVAAHEFHHLGQNREDEAAGWRLWSHSGSRLGDEGEAEAERVALDRLEDYRAETMAAR